MQRRDLTGEMSAYIAGAAFDRLPAAVVERAKVHVLDTLGAVVSGSQLKPGQLVREFVRGQGGPPEASVAASGLQTSAVLAALANGTMAHADETDDVHFASATHPGAPAVAAALAVGETTHRSGRDFIMAVVLGYDVTCRVSRALDRDWMAGRGLNSRSVSAVFGATAAASRLLGLTVDQVRYALAFAATQASGLVTWRQEPEHVDKALTLAGLPARNGVTAALWAQAGFTAAPDVFDGEENVFRAFCQEPRPAELVAELGARFEIMGASIKKYPVGQPVQAPLEGYFQLVAEHGLTGDDIEEVVVRLAESGAHTVDDRLIPDINCQYLLALAMLDGRLDFHSAHDPGRMTAPDVLAAKRRVRLEADPELTRGYPAVRNAIVEIATRDGRRFRRLIDRLPGSPHNPLSSAEVEAKFLSLTAPVLGAERGQAVVEQVRELEALPDVSRLGSLLRA